MSRSVRRSAMILGMFCPADKPSSGGWNLCPSAVVHPISVRRRSLMPAEITITPQGERTFEVAIDGASRHVVRVPARFGDDDLEGVVRESFAFLLEREPPSSILPEFSLDVIGRYFPEYDEELERRRA